MDRIGLTSMIFASLLLGACDFREFDSSDRYQSDFHYSYAMKPGDRLEVENFNGSVDIASWDQAKCDISGVKSASTTELRDRIKIEVHQTGGGITVRSVRPAGDFHGNIGVRYTIHVPRKVELSRIVSSNGGIKVEETEGRAELKTSNGPVRVESLRGELSIQTSNGSVKVQDVTGNMSLRTSNGSIRAEHVTAGVEATTSNGSITVQLDENAQSTGALKFESNNGRIDLTLPGSLRSEVRARTSNSGITVRLPANASTRVRAETSHGQIRSDFATVSSEDDRRGRHGKYEGTIGSGGPLIDLHTTNGSIQLLKI